MHELLVCLRGRTISDGHLLDEELPLADGPAAALARLDHLERCRHPVQSAAKAKPTPALRSPQRRARPSPETSNERAM